MFSKYSEVADYAHCNRYCLFAKPIDAAQLWLAKLGNRIGQAMLCRQLFNERLFVLDNDNALTQEHLPET